MRIKQKEGFIVGIVTLILFLAGSVLCAMNRWNPAEVLYHPSNIVAIAMAAFLTLSEVVFFWAHSVAIHVRSFWRKVPAFLCMIALGCTIAWTIGTEWHALNAKKTAEVGAAAVDGIREKANKEAKGAKTQTQQQIANNANAMNAVTKQFADLGQENTLPYQLNFLTALMAIAILTFTVDRKKKAVWVRKGNSLPQVQKEQGFFERLTGRNAEPVEPQGALAWNQRTDSAEDIKVVPSDKGVRVYDGQGKYLGHISANKWEQAKPETQEQVVSLLPQRKIGF